MQPDEVYNLGAQSHVKVSFDQPEYTADIVATGTLRLAGSLEGLYGVSGKPVRFYQAGSSEMFGSSAPPQNENTPFHPRSPYAVGKVAAHHFVVNYREAYGMFLCNGILFNHESPRRGETFVTARSLARWDGSSSACRTSSTWAIWTPKRDWGFAGDYVKAMWLMLQQDEPDDYVVATGDSHSVERVCRDGVRIRRS